MFLYTFYIRMAERVDEMKIKLNLNDVRNDKIELNNRYTLGKWLRNMFKSGVTFIGDEVILEDIPEYLIKEVMSQLGIRERDITIVYEDNEKGDKEVPKGNKDL